MMVNIGGQAFSKLEIPYHTGMHDGYCTRVEFSELKIPYDTVMTADFADSECEASAKSCYQCAGMECPCTVTA